MDLAGKLDMNVPYFSPEQIDYLEDRFINRLSILCLESKKLLEMLKIDLQKTRAELDAMRDFMRNNKS